MTWIETTYIVKTPHDVWDCHAAAVLSVSEETGGLIADVGGLITTPGYFLKALPGKLRGKFEVEEKVDILHLKGNAAECLASWASFRFCFEIRNFGDKTSIIW